MIIIVSIEIFCSYQGKWKYCGKSSLCFEKNEIQFEYYYNEIDDFSSEKEINYLNKFLKVEKFNQKKWLNPVVDVYHATFNYSKIICGKNFNFMSRIVIRR